MKAIIEEIGHLSPMEAYGRVMAVQGLRV